MTDPLTGDQRQRLAVLHAVWDALHVGEVDVWDLIRAAHWVHSGEDMLVAERDVKVESGRPE